MLFVFWLVCSLWGPLPPCLFWMVLVVGQVWVVLSPGDLWRGQSSAPSSWPLFIGVVVLASRVVAFFVGLVLWEVSCWLFRRVSETDGLSEWLFLLVFTFP